MDRNFAVQEAFRFYSGDLQAHLENLKPIGKYTHKITLIEIVLRNSLNHLLSTKDTDWINNSTDPRVIQIGKFLDNLLRAFGERLLEYANS